MTEDRITHAEVRDAPPHDHAVHVTADDRAIDREIIRFVEEGLRLGEGVIIAANAEHRASIAGWCYENASARDTESLVVVDAAEALQAFMVMETPDPELFNANANELIDRAARDGRRVRVFGEMVAILWSDGNVAAALELESLWNDIATRRRFFLMCAYPEALLAEAPLGAVNAMCDRHSDLSLLGYLPLFAGATTAMSSCAERLFVPTPAAVGAARQVAINTLVEWGLAPLVDRCVAITSELTANALHHAESAFRLTLSRDAASLRIAVEDAVAKAPTPSRWPRASNGRGLARVQSIASDWGWEVTPDGKTVWAELAV